MARGRPRKQGRRDKSGKLRPIIMPDRGNDRTAAKREKFGTDGADAIGRAYRAGLLGEDGQALMRAARDVYRTYWSTFGVGKVNCPLGDRGGGSGRMGEKRTEDWLNRKLADIGPVGGGIRSAFDQLVLDDHFDYGPDWLDFLIMCKESRPSDPLPEIPKAKLDLAVEALQVIVHGDKYRKDMAA